MSGELTIDTTFDINGLFNLSVDFEVLKKVISTLVTTQKQTNARLAQMEEQLGITNENYNKLSILHTELEKKTEMGQFNSGGNILNSNFDTDFEEDPNLNTEERKIAKEKRKEKRKRIKEEEYEDDDDEVSKKKKLNADKDKDKKVDEDGLLETEQIVDEPKDENVETEVVHSLANDELFKALLKRVNKLENLNIKDTFKLILNDLTGIKTKSKNILDKVEMNFIKNEKSFGKIEEKQEIYNTKIDQVDKQIDEFKQQFEDINAQLMDLNLFNSMGGNKSDGTSNQVVNTGGADPVAISNLEKKLFKKFEFVDEKIKKNENEIYHNKNEIISQKNVIEALNKALKDANELINSQANEMTTNKMHLREEITENTNQINIKIDENLDNTNNQINTVKDDMKKMIQELKDREPTENAADKGGKEGDAKSISTITKKIIEMDKTLKGFMSSCNMDIINRELNYIKDVLENKPTLDEIEDLKNTDNNLTSQVQFLKDNLVQIMEDRRIIDDVNWLRKKVEHISSSMQNVKHDDGDNNKSRHGEIINSGKFVDVHTFNEFARMYQKEILGISEKFEEHKRMIDDIIENLKIRPTLKDIKALEEYIMTKLDELKIASTRKFADKQDTHKNAKYLDTQIKHIIDVYIKKMEKGDNWLLAKKPLGGTSCASCESYIGDLNDTNQYLAWNKYPMRDPNENKYRVGNGFSKMLNLLNVDGAKKQQHQTSYDFYSHNNHSSAVDGEANGSSNINNSQTHHRFASSQEGSSANILLPKVGQLKKDKLYSTLNNSSDNLNNNIQDELIGSSGNMDTNHNVMNSMDEDNQPKIVRIYKKK